MAASVRARRPASPPPGYTLSTQTAPQASQRFPQPRHEHMDADERRALASKGAAPGRAKMYPPGGLNMSSGEWKLLFLLVFIASGVRLYKLSKPSSVVFDEVHFGKFASRYIKTRYFVDVHPPLAKLMITLAAWVSGYNGDFDFKQIGKVYEKVPYIAMRMVPALFGVATVPLAYMTLRLMDCKVTTALLAAILVTFENGMVTQSRHILLDSPLIFFTALTVFFWSGFCNEDRHEPFTETWWAWLVLSGLSLGAVFSCKWVGLFTIATIGFNTVYQLWNLLGNLRVPPKLFIKHFMARALCLILIPTVFYMAMFSIHFAVLQNSGEGDGFMSSEFQHTLGGRKMGDTYADVALGSDITLRHVNTQGGYLHSHPHNYPTGSKQQQITLYPHRDHNNVWRIYNTSASGGTEEFDYVNEPIRHVHFGMRIKLFHVTTERRLHSHDHRPPVSDVDFQNEVSAYGATNFKGDANDDWIVEFESGHKADKESYKRLRTLRTKFRLKHALSGCYLFSHKVKLPDWGFEQQEVTCNKNAVKENSLWYIETNTHPALPKNAPKVNYRLPGFFSKFWELQTVMWTTNAGLTDRHTYDSRPESWPMLRRGINFWVKEHRHIYLIGNPFIWWMSSLAVFAYGAVRGFLVLRAKRGYRDFESTKVVKYDALCGFLFMGWALHYLPFFIMGRQLFLHHYFPALYFAILLLCTTFDLATSTVRPRVRLQIAAVIAILAITVFVHFSSLAYGTPWTKKQCRSAKWVKTWDFSCNEFLDDYSQYAGIQPATPTKSTTPVATIGGEPGGRDAVVVPDLHKAKEQGKEDTTSIIVGLEPGRDIFADKAAKGDVKSQAPPIVPPADNREISHVVTEPQATVAAEKAPPPAAAKDEGTTDKAPEVPKEAVKGEEDVKVPEYDSSQQDPVIPAEAKQPAGPKQEVEAEADKAAQELYPDDAGKI